MENQWRYDLLGDPVPANHGERGRPAHVPTVENQRKIMVLLGLGHEIREIAKAIGITQPTLRTHYSSLLKQREMAKARIRAANLMMLWDAADGGNVGAMKAVRALIEKADLADIEKQFRDGKVGAHAARPIIARPVRETPSGKKELANAQAAAAEQLLAARGIISPPPGHA